MIFLESFKRVIPISKEGLPIDCLLSLSIFILILAFGMKVDTVYVKSILIHILLMVLLVQTCV